MMRLEDLSVGLTVYTNVEETWIKGSVRQIIGETEHNPGQDLIGVNLDGYGLEILSTTEIYPAPDLDASYIVQEVVEHLPDDRVYEFGIGDLANADDPYYAATQKTKPTGQKRIIATERCAGCGGEFPSAWMMSANLGRACPDCYDRLSG
jgi:hypothetical protein